MAYRLLSDRRKAVQRWKKKHPEMVREQERRYRKKVGKKELAKRQRIWKKRNPERVKLYRKRYLKKLKGR